MSQQIGSKSQLTPPKKIQANSQNTALILSRIAIMALFFCSGFTYAVWGVHVPIIKEKFGLNDASLSWALFAVAAGAMLTMGHIGRWINQYGSAKMCQLGAVLFALSAASIMLMPSYWLLIPSLVLFGVSNSIFDVAMNAQAVVLEEKYARPVMSGLHGLFSVGGICGALLGSAWIAHQFTSYWVFALTAMLIITLTFLGKSRLLADSTADNNSSAHAVSSAKKVLLMLGILSFLGLMAEGAMYDWSSIYMRDIVKSDMAWIGAGYAGFCSGMTLGRFTGDYIRSHLGSVRILQLSGLLAFIGILLVLIWPAQLEAVLGFILVGLGCSNFVPVIIASSTKIPGVSAVEAIAFVGRIGYLGILLGPVIIGFIANQAGLAAGVFSVGLCALIIALSAKRILAKG